MSEDEVTRFTKAEERFRAELADDPDYVAWRESTELPRAFDLERAGKRSGARPVVRLLHTVFESANQKRARAIRFDFDASRIEALSQARWSILHSPPRKLRVEIAWHLKVWAGLPVGSLDRRWEGSAHFSLADGMFDYRLHFIPEADLAVVAPDAKAPHFPNPQSPSALKLVAEANRHRDDAEKAIAEERLDAAVGAYRKALAVGRRLDQEGVPIVTASLEGLVDCTEDSKQALVFANQLLQANRKAHGPKSPLTADALILVGSRQVELGRHREAEKHLLEAVQVLEKAYGSDALELCRVFSWLAHSYSVRGDGKAAEEWLARAEAVDAVYIEGEGEGPRA